MKFDNVMKNRRTTMYWYMDKNGMGGEISEMIGVKH